MTVSINLADPKVKKILGERPKRELVHIAGDMDTGISQTIRLEDGKHEVLVTYKEFLLTVDVYALPNEPLRAVLICPRCKHCLTVPGDRKAIDFVPDHTDFRGGALSIETFECTWEIADAGEHKPGLVAGGMTLCRWRAAIDNNIAKDA